MRRVAFRMMGALLLWATTVQAADVQYPSVVPGHVFAFPADHGAHEDFRTEWWYVTGWLKAQDGSELGFQVTFFRSRLPIASANPSRFAPRQLLFAHAALSDPTLGKMLHDQRTARAGFGIAETSRSDTDIRLDRWTLLRDAASGVFQADIPAQDFSLHLSMTPGQPVLLQGQSEASAGFSRKGPHAEQASNYYSLPQLQVSGSVERGGNILKVQGTAWLDREWSSAYLDPNASGWDWAGLNLDDGGALMAFRIRDRHGAPLWAGGTLRTSDGKVRRFAPDEVRFETLRSWRSPRSGVSYPVSQRLTAGDLTVQLLPLMDDQELDSQASTGTIYWEGAVRVQGAEAAAKLAQPLGRGYLELTGYDRPLKL